MRTDTPPMTEGGSSPRVLIVALGLLALVLAGCGHANPKPPPDEQTDYVALGDSYTAVAGAGPFQDRVCFRSDTDYPALVAQRMDISSFSNVSCGGATSDALVHPQIQENQRGSNQPQLNALTTETKLVTIGIGLNNDKIAAALLYSCLRKDGKLPASCAGYLKAQDSGIPGIIANMAGTVGNDLTKIRERSPKARIILVGYPRTLPDQGNCPDLMPYPAKALDRIRVVLKLANQDLAAVAKRAKVDYIDMYAASVGHDACSDDPWVAGSKDVPDKALNFHPYDSYHQAVADKIVALLGKQ